jgi:phage FluMu protein Com
VAYLRCPECKLTAPATAYYLRGDQCPRCLTAMEPAERFRDAPSRAAAAAAVSGEAAAMAAVTAARQG